MRKLGSNAKPPATNPDAALLWFSRGDKNPVKGVKRGALLQVIASKAKIKFQKCPVTPIQFDILNL
jgi:hypothetical protein